MTHRHDAPDPIEFDDLYVPQGYLTMHRVPIYAELAPVAAQRSPSMAWRWLAKAMVMAVWVGLLWLFGWYVTDAKGGFVVAIIGGFALLPYILMIDWEA